MGHEAGNFIILRYGDSGGGNEATIVGSVSSTLTTTRDAIETTDKDDSQVKSYIYGDYGWTVSGEFNYDQAGAEGFDEVTDDLIAGTVKGVIFGGSETGDEIWSGDVIVTGTTINAPQNEVATFTVDLQGTGALTSATVA